MKKYVVCLLFIFSGMPAMQQAEINPEIISTFKIAQTIFERWKEVAAEEYQQGCHLTLPESLQPEPSTGQTQQGLRIIIREYPRYMESPWGLLTLCTKAEHPHPNCFNTPTERLLKHIEYEQEENLSSWDNNRGADSILSPAAADRIGMFPLSIQASVASQLQFYKNRLLENPGVVIKILSTNSDVCTPAVISPQENYRDSKKIMAEWQALEILAKNGYASPPQTISKKAQSPKNATLPSLAMLPTSEPTSPRPEQKQCSLM